MSDSGTQIPRRVGGEPAQIVGVDTSNVVTVSVGAASSSAELPDFPSVVVESDVDCYVAMGGSGVTASNATMPLWARMPRVVRVRSVQTHLAAQHDSNTGTVWITPVRMD